MKKNSCLSLFLLLIAPCIHSQGNRKTTSHTHFRVRPQFQIGSPELTSTQRHVHHMNNEKNQHKFGALLFGGRSQKKKNLGTFFMPFGNNSATVSGVVEKNSQNILTQNFNLFSIQFAEPVLGILGPELPNNGTPFESEISIEPRQSVVGLGLSYEYEFCIHGKDHWLHISAPIVRVKNSINFKENITNKGEFFNVASITNTNLTKELRNMKEAVVQECWEFGKLSQESLDETKLAFVQIQLGKHSFETDCSHLSPYIGVTAPTGNTPEAEFVFEPIVGHGKHAAIFWGLDAGWNVGESLCGNFEVHYEINSVMHYFFNKKQKRSVDLKNGPWTRYTELYKNRAQAQQAFDLRNEMPPTQGTFLATPGINELTFDMRISPGFSFTTNNALLFDYCYCNTMIITEIGYNFFFHQEESVKLDQTFTSNAAIKDYAGRGITNPKRNITADAFTNNIGFCNLQLNPNIADALTDFNLAKIKESNLDFDSAAHPCTVAHTVYATISGRWDNCLCPLDLSIGGSYEFSGKTNTALDRWLLWGTIGTNF